MKLVVALTLYISAAKANHFAPIIEHHAHKHGIDPFLVAAVIQKESQFVNNCCYRGAHGLMQVQLKSRSCDKQSTLKAKWRNLYTPYYNIKQGVELMAWAKRYCKSASHHWLLHYNQGKKVFDNGYAKRVLKIYKKLKKYSPRDEV